MYAYIPIDPGGATDVFVGYTDRAVGAYRWDSDAHSLVALTERLPLNGQVRIIVSSQAVYSYTVSLLPFV